MRATHVFRLFSMDTEREYVYTILLYKVKTRLFHTKRMQINYLCLLCFCMVIMHASNNKVRVRRCGSTKRLSGYRTRTKMWHGVSGSQITSVVENKR